MSNTQNRAGAGFGAAREPPRPAAAGPESPPFHVELTPVAVDARPFHALHGAAPGAVSAAPLPSHLEVAPGHPAGRKE